MNVSHRGADSLPESWAETRIGEIYEVVGGGTPSTASDEYWGGDVPWITSADIDDLRDVKVRRHVTPKGIRNSTTTMVPQGTLLVATRVGLGKIAIANTPICFSQDLQGLVQRPDLVVPEYCLYYLSSELQRLKFDGRGTTISGITKKQLKDTPFPLAPYSEQRRIVARVEELFSELDKGVESLTTARRQLGVYRQSVLKHAFEGKLTAQGREENKDKLEKPERLLARVKNERVVHYERQLQKWRTAIEEWEDGDEQARKPRKPPSPKSLTKLDESFYPRLPQLPESWKWEKLGWMTCGVEYGTAAKSSKSGTVSVLRMGNIQNARFDWSDLVYTSDDDEIAKYLLREGDVLFNRTNSPELVGKTAIYRSELPAIFAGYLIRVNQISAVVESQYLNLFLNSDVARQYGDSVKTDGVNQSNINGAKLVNYPFPYCSVQEQREIVRILDKTMSIVDDAEAKIDAELERTVALRQAILKKAFAGHLVAQDPGDEPASVLLEKIRTERAKAGQTARRNRKAKTAA